MTDPRTPREIRDLVQRYLAELGIHPEPTRDGGWSFRHGSARLFVRVREHTVRRGTSSGIVELNAPLLSDVPPSDTLWRHVALHGDNWVFGHLWASEQDDGAVTLILTHRLLGDHLDSEELKSAVAGLAKAADDLDDELRNRFGGRRFHDN